MLLGVKNNDGAWWAFRKEAHRKMYSLSFWGKSLVIGLQKGLANHASLTLPCAPTTFDESSTSSRLTSMKACLLTLRMIVEASRLPFWMPSSASCIAPSSSTSRSWTTMAGMLSTLPEDIQREYWKVSLPSQRHCSAWWDPRPPAVSYVSYVFQSSETSGTSRFCCSNFDHEASRHAMMFTQMWI